jgi:hypothetical protein
MPWALGDRWSLAVGVLNGSAWADWSQRLPVEIIDAPQPLRRFEAHTWVRLTTFERQGRPLVEILPDESDFQPAQPLQANFADQMQLLGYDTAVETDPAALSLTLYWQALTALPRDYTIFVHLLDAEGNLVAQHDNGPWWEVAIPTSTWQPGEKLRDQHRLDLPADLPPGSYQLQIGVYYWETLERLPVLENGTPLNNYVELGRVDLK